jgi:hypothetical protein
VKQISDARNALASGDKASAIVIIDEALKKS